MCSPAGGVSTCMTEDFESSWQNLNLNAAEGSPFRCGPTMTFGFPPGKRAPRREVGGEYGWLPREDLSKVAVWDDTGALANFTAKKGGLGVLAPAQLPVDMQMGWDYYAPRVQWDGPGKHDFLSEYSALIEGCAGEGFTMEHELPSVEQIWRCSSPGRSPYQASSGGPHFEGSFGWMHGASRAAGGWSPSVEASPAAGRSKELEGSLPPFQHRSTFSKPSDGLEQISPGPGDTTPSFRDETVRNGQRELPTAGIPPSGRRAYPHGYRVPAGARRSPATGQQWVPVN